MIHIFGAGDTREYEAGLALREIIIQAWPTVGTSESHNVWLITNAKCHGQQTRDVDILLLAKFDPGLKYKPFLTFQTVDGQTHRPDIIYVNSLCLAIEVKDHEPEKIRFVGTSVEVLYNGHWHNASEQNDKQAFAVKGYLDYHGIHSPWVTPLLWLRNVPNNHNSFPHRPNSILGSPISWNILLNILGQNTIPRKRDGQWYLDAFYQDPTTFPLVVDLFTKVLEPTHLDRQRLERINQQNIDMEIVKPSLGEKLVILRGRSGTGKTIRLLQLAKYLCDTQGARILLLTYNRALVADIRRLLTILGIKDTISGSTIQIQTIHSFMYATLQGLGIFEQGYKTFLNDYEHLKAEALKFLTMGAISAIDMEKFAISNRETFQWDYVFIDEGQDWPEDERDLLMRFYSYSQFVVVDGIDQLVRNNQLANWRNGLTRNNLHNLSLKKCLRMKAGLARFVSAVARNLGLLYNEWDANLEIPGGKVIIIDGPYFKHKSLHESLIKLNKEDGNKPIDMLFCVPPNQMVSPVTDKILQSKAASSLEQWGFKTWDGAVEDVRESYPTDLDQLRIVQYESCRGLEGWITINLGLDSFYEHKFAIARTLIETNSAETSKTLEDGNIESQSHLYAARWLLIPLTRALDTLVIQLDKRQSPIRTALKAAATEYSEYVEWIDNHG